MKKSKLEQEEPKNEPEPEEKKAQHDEKRFKYRSVSSTSMNE